MMIKLIVNADDFGLTEGTNYGIIDGHINGLVNSTTMMMNMPGTEHAVRLAKSTTYSGRRTSRINGRRTTVKGCTVTRRENGSFHKQSVVREGNINPEEVEREWTAQIEKFYLTD